MHSFGVHADTQFTCYQSGIFEYYGREWLGFVSDDKGNYGAQFHPERSGYNGLSFFNDLCGPINA